VKYWMRHWYRSWNEGQKDEAKREEQVAELDSGREQMPPTMAQRIWRGLAAGRGGRSRAARRLQALLGNRGLLGLGAGRPLTSAMRERLERALGADLSTVRLHHDPAAAQAAGAQAFAVGEHIVLGKAGDAGNAPLMAHEAAHVVQAEGVPVSGISKPGGASEQEAEQAARAVQSSSPTAISASFAASPCGSCFSCSTSNRGARAPSS
jgi:hypothetical protein